MIQPISKEKINKERQKFNIPEEVCEFLDNVESFFFPNYLNVKEHNFVKIDIHYDVITCNIIIITNLENVGNLEKDKIDETTKSINIIAALYQCSNCGQQIAISYSFGHDEWAVSFDDLQTCPETKIENILK